MYGQISQNKRKTFFLFFGFIFLLAALGWVISKATGNDVIFLVVGVGSLLYSLFSYFAGAKIALAVNGAKEISKRDNPRYYRIVENLTIATGMPMPKVYIMNDPAPNAFATGRNPKNSAVCATTGLLEIMDDEELEGVMAHELGHIQNYDIRVSTIAFALVGIVSLICDMFLHFAFWGGGDDDERGGNNQLLMILAIVAVILAPIAASMIQLAISRRREYLADATGAMTTRYPEGLARALEKIEAASIPMKHQNSSTAHLFFSNPLKKGSMAALFSTHPPIKDRVRILRGMKLN